MSKLGEFEGDDVLGAAIEIRNIAGGLNKSMDIDPEVFHKGDEVTIVARCVVTAINHPGVPDTDGVKRVHVLKATEASRIDDALVAEVLDEQARRIEAAKIKREQEGGVYQLPAALAEAHEKGDHADGLVESCPACEAEQEAAASE